AHVAEEQPSTRLPGAPRGPHALDRRAAPLFDATNDGLRDGCRGGSPPPSQTTRSTKGASIVDLYAIHRRSGFSPDEVEQADARSKAAAAERADRLPHIRIYLLEEGGGRLGTTCLQHAPGPE